MLDYLALAALLAAPSPAVDSFSFIHMTDQHVPYSNTLDVMREVVSLSEVPMAPYGITAPSPSFIISTGDCTEFGGGNGWWEQYIGVFNETGRPHYHVCGNHDNTWDSLRPRIAALYGAPYYSFDYGGVHFAGLDTASPQDPRPCIGREELLWLAEDLKTIAPATPIILFYHHPPTNEYASKCDRYRLYDLLRGHNVLVHLVGHGHGIRHLEEEGFDFSMGGSTYGDNAGCAMVDIRDGMLRIAYRKSGEAAASIPVLEKPIGGPPEYPRITITQPKPGSVHAGPVGFEGTVEGDFEGAQVLLDDEDVFPLELEGQRFTGQIDLPAEKAGAHFYRVCFRRADGTVVWRAGDFVADTHPTVRVTWRTMLGGSSKSTPAFLGDLVLIGANDGRLYALDATSGEVKWTVQTGGDVLGGPRVRDGKVYVGSGDGKLYEVTREGEVARTFDAGAPIYSSPAAAKDAVIVATSAGTVHAVSLDIFEEKWRSDAPEYAIEDTLFVTDGLVCFGAWDTFIYALDADTGDLRWRCAASGTLEGGAKRYYSPADCGPAVCGNRLYIADRKYHLSVVDTSTGELVASREGISGTGISEDGKAVYLRGTKGGLTELDAAGNEVWTADVPLGYIAAAPVESDGVVYSVSTLGTVSAVDAASGEVRWTIDVLPGFYAMADPAIRGGIVYVAGMDGSVTALAPR